MPGRPAEGVVADDRGGPALRDLGINGIADGLPPGDIPGIYLSMVEALSGAASAVALVLHSSR